MERDLTLRSQKLRREMTNEERHLWYDFLKKLPLTINRQKKIGYYIADFYCASKKLIIEIDGSQHYEEEGLKRDEERNGFLTSMGYTVRHYSNRDINSNFDGVCRDIMLHIQGEL